MDDDISTIDSSPADLEPRLKEKGLLSISFWDISFETISMLTRSHTAWKTSACDNVDDSYNTND